MTATPPPGASAPTPPSAPAPPTACPKCGTAAPPGARFCNVCGSSLFVQGGSSTGTAAPAGAPPVDIRQKVEGDRGALKRLQLLIPGYRGYREGEDLRAADSLLRRQVADKVHIARTTIENSRAALTNGGQFQTLNDLAPLIADLMRLEGEIRHAEQGYTGISPAVRANPQQLDRLYEYDYGFATAADQLNQTIAPLPSLAASAAGSGAGALATLVATARGQIGQLDTAFKARLQAVEGVRVS
ncbi:MAG TPA: zinc ribbon domain-containing protein [Thermoplasmata archaeon]|nr:zinc ribbon domain-containing protein [Thermoplasmata archaeon]